MCIPVLKDSTGRFGRGWPDQNNWRNTDSKISELSSHVRLNFNPLCPLVFFGEYEAVERLPASNWILYFWIYNTSKKCVFQWILTFRRQGGHCTKISVLDFRTLFISTPGGKKMHCPYRVICPLILLLMRNCAIDTSLVSSNVWTLKYLIFSSEPSKAQRNGHWSGPDMKGFFAK